MRTSIVDFFDVNDPAHIKAFEFVTVHGYWPPDFEIPKRVAFPAGWVCHLHLKIIGQLLTQRTGLISAATRLRTAAKDILASRSVACFDEVLAEVDAAIAGKPWKS